MKISEIGPVVHTSWESCITQSHTKPSTVTAHCTHLHAGTWESLPLFVCESSSLCVSLLGIIMMKPNRPLLPDSLRCTANVSPLNKRCAGSISLLWSQGLLLGSSLPHITLSDIDVISSDRGQNRLLGYLLPNVFVSYIQEARGGIFQERKQSL